MTRLKSYLKPFIWALVAVFVLLFLQALCDLNLPNYMSDIVNVGIQQNGIEHAAPDKISASGLSFIQNFMIDEEKGIVSEAYQQSEDVWKKTESSEELDAAFQNASFVLVHMMQSMAKQSGMTQDGEGEAGVDVKTLDMTNMYQYAPMLKMIPQAQFDQARAELQSASEMMPKQYAVALAEGYYRELGMDMAAIQRSYILGIGIRMLLVALVGGIATVLVGLLCAKMAAGVARSLRRDVFSKVESFSSGEIHKFGTASLITRTTNDIQQVQMLIQMGTRMILYAPLMCVGGIIMALDKSVSMSWIIALAGVILISLMTTMFSVAVPKFKIIQKLVDKLNLVSREHLSGLMVIRAFGTRDHEEQRFDEVNREVTKVNTFIQRIMSLMMPIMTLVMSTITLLVIWVGAHQISASQMQVGDMMAFMQYAMQIIMSFLMVSMIFFFAPRAAVSANRIADVLESESSIKDPTRAKPFDASMKGVVEFRDVSFKYEGAEEYALHHITFRALPGQTTAIIGSTGSGKSTIANMVLRFYDATEGRVLVDGADVRDVSQKALRDKIGFVPQKGVLLSGTIASNLRYGNKEAADDEIREAAQVAQALTFIEEKSDGFDAEIAQGGDNVSGGQKQRLSIARALARHPEIFIFDDSFSALDFKTDVALRRALNEHAKDSTVLIVAQRVSTILHAEQIIVLEKGEIVGKGTHQELLKVCPEYQEIAGSQLSEEELQ